jgi:hypothetical protein
MKRKLLLVSIFGCCAILFSLLTVFYQVTELSLHYLETTQVFRHERVLRGTAGAPFQYRILSEYLVEAVILVLRKFGFPYAATTSAFILFRIFQNTVIFLLASLYYKRLGLTTYTTLLGLSILAWGMSHSYFDADLTFNSYSDIVLYLAAGLIILQNRPAWLIPIVGLAALNRETSGLIPVMLVLHSLYAKTDKTTLKHDVVIATVAFGLYIFVFVSLRYVYGVQPLVLPYGNHPGLELFRYNMFRYITWVQLFATLGIVPILAILSARQWPRCLHPFFWAVVPIWVLAHSFLSILAESRLLLVPFAIIFIPGALFGIDGARVDARTLIPVKAPGETTTASS